MRQRCSWIICTYNDKLYTAEAIRSIRSNYHNDFDEIILIDDGSEKKYSESIVQLANNYNCSFYLEVREDRPMLPKLRQMGRTIAKYEWVIFMDNDARLDSKISHPQIVESMQRRFEKTPSIGAIQPMRRTPRNMHGANKFNRNLDHVGSDREPALSKAMYPDGCFWLTHKSTFDKWHFDESLSCFEDSHIGMQMYEAGLRIFCDNSISVFHQTWSTNLWKFATEHPEYREKVISENKDTIEKMCIEWRT